MASCSLHHCQGKVCKCIELEIQRILKFTHDMENRSLGYANEGIKALFN